MPHDLDRSAACLSSGTLATLTGYRHARLLDPIHADFVRFCQDFPDYETWQDAWHAYEATGGTVLAWTQHQTTARP